MLYLSLTLFNETKDWLHSEFDRDRDRACSLEEQLSIRHICRSSCWV